jgi:thiosulfate dehydrogenase
MTAPSKDYPMRRFICLMWVVAAFAAANGSRDVLAADIPQVNLTEWTPPDIKTVGDDALGKLIKYGYALMTDTANQIGPTVSDPAKRFSGNNLTCQNCHLKAGTQPYAMPLTGVWGQFPQYRGREGEIGTLEERINGCMERSMNGRVLPLAGREMKAYMAARSRRTSARPAMAPTGWDNAPRAATAISIRRCGVPTATTTAPAWRAS